MSFTLDTLFEYNTILYGIIGILGIYLVLSILGTFRTIEGLTNQNQGGKSVADIIAEGDIKQLKSAIQKADNVILVNKYRSDYEDALIDLEEILNQSILMKVLTMSSDIDSKDGVNTIKPETISAINNLYTLRDNIATTMDYIDGKK